MEPGSFFIITEFAVGVAGFSGIIAALGYRAGELGALGRFRVLNLLTTALAAAFGGLVPQLLAGFGFVGESLWQCSSIVLGICLVALLVDPYVRRNRLSANERKIIHPGLWLLIMGSIAALAVLQAANAISASPSPGPIFAGLVGLLGVSAILFVRFLVHRPRVPPAA